MARHSFSVPFSEPVTAICCHIVSVLLTSKKMIGWACCTANSSLHFTHNRRPIKCPYSGLRFSLGLCSNVWEFTLIYMQEHMAKHFSLLRYSCPVCNKSFSKLGHLNMHIRIHRGTKEYSCIHCGKIFVNMNLLRTHIRSHMVQRPYICGFCGRGFFRPRDKVEHERIHTGEKTYPCSVCGMRFRVRYCLSLHMRRHTDNLVPVDILFTAARMTAKVWRIHYNKGMNIINIH